MQALEKISHEQPLACLEAGAIMAVLNFIHFFSPSVQVMECGICSYGLFHMLLSRLKVDIQKAVGSLNTFGNFPFIFVNQRVALATVVNICKKLPSDTPSNLMEAVPILCGLLQHEDQQV